MMSDSPLRRSGCQSNGVVRGSDVGGRLREEEARIASLKERLEEVRRSKYTGSLHDAVVEYREMQKLKNSMVMATTPVIGIPQGVGLALGGQQRPQGKDDDGDGDDDDDRGGGKGGGDDADDAEADLSVPASPVSASPTRATGAYAFEAEGEGSEGDGEGQEPAGRRSVVAEDLRPCAPVLRCVRTMVHHDRVEDISWAPDSQRIAAALQDGTIPLSDALGRRHGRRAHQLQVIDCMVHHTRLKACAFEREQGRIMCVGGTDNRVSIFTLGSVVIPGPSATLLGHEEYISSLVFHGENHVLSGSGDGHVLAYDVEHSEVTHRFEEHTADVLSLSWAGKGSNGHCFASSSSDCTTRCWDLRSGECTHTFRGFESDVHTVRHHPSGNAVLSGADDSSMQLFDLRSGHAIKSWTLDDVSPAGISAVEFSSSGRVIFAGLENDVLLLDCCRNIPVMAALEPAHSGAVTSLELCPSGQSIASASADHSVRIWA